ncbi:DUF1638 domain-containing protein [Jannaschia rubra]|uniref:DUF1638 domain-containing protein n=1 Tax=Jannaschia rubra TaxID=282197 RepID=A0A0M6XNQ5_9RHOB|nr:DUF1638 domain-containing protein [Jannaschia rubra]CTQ31841.1 hypothetical protein JAN5088_00600 [Jannaschia rubra]SFG52553.1 Protein of unknown function [Jannaschia rubra]
MITDASLTRDGLEAEGGGRVLVIACGALAHEILAIKAANALDHIDLHCLPAILHNRPDRIAPAVEAALDARAGAYDRAFVAYADCGTGGALARVCAERGVGMIEGPHCYAFFEGQDAFAARDEVDAFYLTDFLARQFDAFVTRPLGLDRHPELREAYFGNYAKVVYLAQTDDPALTTRAQAAAETLGLAFERRFTGLGPFASALHGAR